MVGETELKSGEVIKGINTKFGYYRQHAIALNDQERVIDVVKEVGEYLELGNGEKITASRLLDRFLFDDELKYNKVEKLSGGERKRLQLLMVLITNPNFLILDEPTNDLDVQTLQVLEDYLLNFNGCLIIVSHDRFFLDKVVGRYFVFKGAGKIEEFIGTYSDFLHFRKIEASEKREESKKESVNTKVKTETKKLSYKEKLELESIEKMMSELTDKVKSLENKLSTVSDPEKITELSKEHHTTKEQLDELEFRWLELSE